MMMHQTRNPNLGMLNILGIQMSNSKSGKCSSHKSAKISKFFQPIPKAPEKMDESQSPYKQCLSDIRKIDLDTSENDFKPPSVLENRAGNKLLKLKPPPKGNRIKKPRMKKNVPPLKKTLSSCFMTEKSGDTDPDHLQMALALSESTYSAENPSNEQIVSNQSSQEKLEDFKRALEQFGFKCNKTKVQPKFKKKLSDTSSSVRKTTKKSRFQFITPILYIRTQEDRDSLISAKVSLCLSSSDENRKISLSLKTEETNYTPSIVSDNLRSAFRCDSRLFKYNSLDLSDLSGSNDMFYVKQLNLSKCECKCGHLLKSWNSISGRDNSPLREFVFTANETQKNMQEVNNSSVNHSRSLSPDMFADYDEDYSFPKNCVGGNGGEVVDLTEDLTQSSKFEEKPVSMEDRLDLTQSSKDDEGKGVTNEETVIWTEKYEQDGSWDPPQKLHNTQSSQESTSSIVISDDELDYSSTYSGTPLATRTSLPRKSLNRSFFTDFNDESDENCSADEPSTSFSDQELEFKTPSRPQQSRDENVIFKTSNITPMIDYEQMDTPGIVNELDKVGIKPLNRPRAVKMLKYIYDTTHPLVKPSQIRFNDDDDDDYDSKSSKRRKLSDRIERIEIVGDIIQNNELSDLIFERTQLKRVSSCRIPLEIVWYNFLSSNRDIKEKILLYEPLQLEILHSMLKKEGFKFSIQDLLTFLDRKCITIRTNQSRNRK